MKHFRLIEYFLYHKEHKDFLYNIALLLFYKGISSF